MLSAPPRVTSCSQTHKNPWLDGKIPAPNELYWGGFLASIIWISVLTCVFKAAFKRYILGVHPSVFVTMPFLYMRYTQNTGLCVATAWSPRATMLDNVACGLTICGLRI